MKREVKRLPYQDKEIYFEWSIPETKEEYPFVMLLHGYGKNEPFVDIEMLQKAGIGTCWIDFCGGSIESRSKGDSKQMSILTEEKEVEAVFSYLQNQDICLKQLSIAGYSQGGMVSLLFACNHANCIKHLFLYSCSFTMKQDWENRLKGQQVEEIEFLGMNISMKYIQDLTYDLESIGKVCTMPIHAYHGEEDSLIHYEDVEKAMTYFPNISLKRMEKEGHSFVERYRKQLSEDIISILN